MRKPLNTQATDNETKVAQEMAAIPQFSGLFLIIVIVAAGFLMLAPISPRLTITFTIEQPSGVPTPSISVIFLGYEKIPFGTALGSTRDTPVLGVIAGLEGPFTVTTDVSYDMQPVTSGSFPNLGVGTYQAKVTLLLRQEDKSVPYVVTLALFENGVKQVEQVVAIFPV